MTEIVGMTERVYLADTGTEKAQSYLAEMGIQRWELSHPECLSGFHARPINLPDSCVLLFVSPQKPQGELAVMFSKVLKSMQLDLDQARHIYPQQLAQLDFSSFISTALTWVWFAGCDAVTLADDFQVLNSPLLAKIQGNNQQRRLLWQQICTYEK